MSAEFLFGMMKGFGNRDEVWMCFRPNTRTLQDSQGGKNDQNPFCKSHSECLHGGTVEGHCNEAGWLSESVFSSLYLAPKTPPGVYFCYINYCIKIYFQKYWHV